MNPIETPKIEWELISRDSWSTITDVLERTRVKGGWLYRTTKKFHAARSYPDEIMAMTFVPLKIENLSGNELIKVAEQDVVKICGEGSGE